MAGQGLGWERTIAVACRAVEHMAEDLLEMTRESNGRGGTFRFDALQGIEGLGWLLLPSKAQGSGHRH